MAEKLKLLVVDDEEGMRDTLSEIFQSKGYFVETASNGAKALKLVKKGFFNVALVDIRLPDMDGVEVLKAIKKESPDTEVVIITAFASLQSSVEALNKGAFAYIMKPFEMDSLVRTISTAAERRHLIMENRELRIFNENIIQSLNEGVLIEDVKGIIAFINPRIEELFGSAKEEIIGKQFESFIAPMYIDALRTRMRSLGKGERYEAAIVTKVKDTVPVIVSAVPLFENEKPKGTLSVLTDISKIKKLEGELTEKVGELEHFNKLMVGRELRMVELKNR